MNDTSQFSPMSYLKIFFRRKELFIVPVFLGLTIGICTGILLPKKYKSSTIILVEEGKTDNPLFDKLAVSTTVQQRMTAISESMLGWNSLVKLINRLGLQEGVKSAKEFENLIENIRGNIIIKLRGSNIIALSYVGTEPEQTQAIVKNITEIFIDKNIETQNKETADAIIFIQEQLKVYKSKIKSAEIAGLEDRLKTLLVDSTDKHPVVKELREQIRIKREELEKENLQYIEDVNVNIKANNPIISEIKKAIDTMQVSPTAGTAATTESYSPKDDLYKIMLVEKLDDVLARDAKINASIYNMLLERLETAKITQRLQSSKEGTRYTILDPPRVPLDPISPNIFLVAMVGLVLGGILGVGLVIGAEFLDRSFLDVEEAKNYLGMPLLGAISKINTVESIKQEKDKTRWVITLTALSGVVMLVITLTVSSFLK